MSELLSRRDFLRRAGAGLGLLALNGCTVEDILKLAENVDQPSQASESAIPIPTVEELENGPVDVATIRNAEGASVTLEHSLHDGRPQVRFGYAFAPNTTIRASRLEIYYGHQVGALAGLSDFNESEFGGFDRGENRPDWPSLKFHEEKFSNHPGIITINIVGAVGAWDSETPGETNDKYLKIIIQMNADGTWFYRDDLMEQEAMAIN